MQHFKTKIIELFGLPKTGKTTSVAALKKQLESKGYSVDVVKERASFCPIEDKLHPSFNFWTTISFMKEYIEANSKSIDILITDRSILDAYIWINLFSKQSVYKDFFKSFDQLASQNFILDNYKLALYFDASIDSIIKRELDRQIIKKPGRIMNSEILNGYSNSYSEIENKLKSISPIYKIDSNVAGIELVLNQVSTLVNELIPDK